MRAPGTPRPVGGGVGGQAPRLGLGPGAVGALHAHDGQDVTVLELQVGERRLDGPLPELPAGAPHRQDTVEPVVGDAPGPGVPFVLLGVGAGVLLVAAGYRLFRRAVGRA